MSDVRMVKLGDIGQVISGATPKTSVPEYWGGDIYWATPKDLSRLESAYIDSTERTITESGKASCATSILPENSVLLSSRAPIVHVAINTTPMATNQGFKSIIPTNDVIPKYLYYWLSANKYYIQSMGNGATFKEISKKVVESIVLPLPPLEEQKRIVSILDKAKSIQEARERQLAALDELSYSIFVDFFGSPDKWSKKYPMTTIGDIALSTQYGTSTKSGDTGKYPVLRMGNITDNGHLDLTDLKYQDIKESEIPKYTVAINDMLFNRTNSKEKVGKSAVIKSNIPLAYAGYLIRVRYKNPHYAEFVATYLNSTYGKSLRQKMAKSAVNQANINATELKNIPIPSIPKEILSNFSYKINKIEKFRNYIYKTLKDNEVLYNSLQYYLYNFIGGNNNN